MFDWLKNILGIKPKKCKNISPPSTIRSGELKFLFETRVWSGPEGPKFYQAFVALSPIGIIAVEEDKPRHPLWVCEIKDLMGMYHIFGYAENAQGAMNVCQRAYANGQLHKYNQKCDNCTYYRAMNGQRGFCTLTVPQKNTLRYDYGCSSWHSFDTLGGK